MENEKRKVGDYTVLCAVNIGSREIILAENEQDMQRTERKQNESYFVRASTVIRKLPVNSSSR